MVAGIVLVALGLKKTLGHVDDHLEIVPAFALLGGLAVYLLAHVAFRYRVAHSLNRQRLALALLLLALLPVATAIPALAALAIATALIWTVIVFDTIIDAETRRWVRHDPASQPHSG